MTHAESSLTDRPTDNPTALSTAWPTARPTGRWLTFAQAGAELGLSAEATRSRARRAGWRTMPGNDGRTLVMIPEELAIEARPAGRPAGRPSEDPVATARSTETLAAAVSSLQGALATLTEQLIRERDRADRAVDQVGRIEKERDALQGQVDALSAKLADAQTELAAARDQSEAARAEAAAAQMAQAEAEADAAELRQAEARGRAGAAWRGSGRRGGGSEPCPGSVTLGTGMPAALGQGESDCRGLGGRGFGLGGHPTGPHRDQSALRADAGRPAAAADRELQQGGRAARPRQDRSAAGRHLHAGAPRHRSDRPGAITALVAAFCCACCVETTPRPQTRSPTCIGR